MKKKKRRNTIFEFYGMHYFFGNKQRNMFRTSLGHFLHTENRTKIFLHELKICRQNLINFGLVFLLPSLYRVSGKKWKAVIRSMLYLCLILLAILPQEILSVNLLKG